MFLLVLFHFIIRDLMKEIGNYYPYFTNEKTNA